MLLLKTDALPDDSARWVYQLKVDGFRSIAFKSGGKVHLRSRDNKDFNERYPSILKGLAKLPDETVVDGELVAFGEDGRPSFSALQNALSSSSPIAHYVFDVLVLAVRDVMGESSEARRDILERKVFPKLSEPVRYLGDLDAPLPDLVASVKAQGFQGLVAKQRNSPYSRNCARTAGRRCA